jgi:hypothetical protein
MGLDVRLPLGFMFLTLGLLLLGYGMLAAGTPGAGMNVGWGVLLLLFGALMLWLARRTGRGSSP